MGTMEKFYRLFAEVFDLLDDVSTDTASMGTPEMLSDETSGDL